MTRIKIFRSSGKITGFEVKGHAGHGEFGNDIVCSAISMLTQTALLGLEKVAEVTVKYDMKDGYLLCQIVHIPSELADIKSTAILETMYEGLANIEITYRKHMRLLDKEEV